MDPGGSPRRRKNFAQTAHHQPLTLVETIDHPEGRLRNHDLDADAGGRSFDSKGSHRHALETEHSATDHLAETFAKSLVAKLRAGREAKACDRIILVADPRMLGKLRDAMDAFTAAAEDRSLDKDLGNLPEVEVIEHLMNAFKL
ncbi:MAG: host attachment protein [Gammaproteobacteria bacterium]|nr:host attachment protein [Gammaproteobacteria bacterium]